MKLKKDPEAGAIHESPLHHRIESVSVIQWVFDSLPGTNGQYANAACKTILL